MDPCMSQTWEDHRLTQSNEKRDRLNGDVQYKIILVR